MQMAAIGRTIYFFSASKWKEEGEPDHQFMFAGRLATTTTNASAAGEYKGRVLIVTFFSAKRLDPLYDFSTHTHIQKEKQIPRPVERLKKLLKNGFFFFSFVKFEIISDDARLDHTRYMRHFPAIHIYTLRWFSSGEEGGCDDHLFPVGSYEQDAVWKEKMMVEAIQRVDGLMRKQIMSLSLRGIGDEKRASHTTER